jgi:release factor glutamine methyltransferase
LAWTKEYLARQGIDDARLASEVLLAHAVGCRRIEIYTRFEQLPEAERLGRFRELVRRAAQHEPVAYLVGEKEFFSLRMQVTRDVLIPRPETELLVECLIDHCMGAGLEHPRVLDVGTGSGCVIVAGLVNLPGATGLATDASEAALAVARANAERHRVADRLALAIADRLDLPGGVRQEGFDVIVCNPPYIPASAVPTLDPEVRDYEPRAALTDEGDGLSFYRDLAAEGPGLLRPGGVILVEVGDGCAAAVADIMTGGGRLVHRGTRKDRVVGRERVLAFAGFSL